MRNLIVSFIGNTDLKLAGLAPDETPSKPDEQPPLFRVVNDLVSRNLFGKDDAILILDDRAARGDDRGRRFCAMLEQSVAVLLDVPSIQVTPLPIDISNPTDLDRLHKEAVAAIKGTADDRTQVIFNLTSGTPAMHTTLVLAGSYLPLARPRFFESSRERQVVEINLPYMVYVRSRIEVARSPNRQVRQLMKKGDPLRGIKLPRLTSVADAAVAAVFGAVAKARNKEFPVTVAGVTGSGKAYVAQAAGLNAGLSVCVVDAEFARKLPEKPGTTADSTHLNIILRHLESASDELLCDIGQALDRHPDWRWTVTLRSDRAPRASDSPLYTALRRRLATGGEFLMPPPNLRTDVVELAEHMFEEAGQWPTKVKERFQYELGSAVLADGLHGLRRWVNNAAGLAPTRHTDESAFKAARKQLLAADAIDVLLRATAVLAAGGCAGFSVPRLIQVVEHATQLIAEAGNRTQDELASRMGYANRTTFANRKAASSDAYHQFVHHLALSSGGPAEPGN